jgi:hypothetical protein
MTTKSEKHLNEADATADEAEAVRQDLRWNVKPGSEEREALIDKTLEAIRVAMIPIRSLMGKAVWGKADVPEKDILAASERLQYQRKQLKKMKR